MTYTDKYKYIENVRSDKIIRIKAISVHLTLL